MGGTEPEPGPGLVAGQPAAASAGSDRVEIIRLAWPVIVDNMLVTMVRMLSLMMVGHLGVEAISAVGLTNQMVMLGMALFMALGVGATALVARFRGSGLRAGANAVVRQSVAISVILGGLAALAGWVYAEPMLRMLGAGDDVVLAGLPYFRLSFLTLIVTAPGITVASCLRGAGDTRTPMNINLIANVVSLVLLYWLINGGLGVPALGLVGAALSILGARIVSMALFLLSLSHGHGWLRFGGSDWLQIDLDLMRRVARIGLPNAFEQLTLRGGQLVFTRLVLSLGTSMYAAHQIGLSITSLAFMPAFGMGAAATTLVGQNLGRDNPQRAERLGLESSRLAMAMSGTVGITYLVFAPQLVSLYSTDPEVVAAGAMVLRIMAVAEPAVGVWFSLSGALRGAGDTRWPLYISTAGVWGVRLVLAYVLALVFDLGLAGVWVAIILDHCARAAMVYGRFRKGLWKRMRV